MLIFCQYFIRFLWDFFSVKASHAGDQYYKHNVDVIFFHIVFIKDYEFRGSFPMLLIHGTDAK